MKLTELLHFDNIVIQCHNEPDADAIASGWALQRCLQANGKTAELIYGGAEELQKPNLRLMKERLHIPVRHVRSLPKPAELLVYVDCQPGSSKVQSFPAKTYAVIDHHKRGGPLPPLHEVRDTYGSCSTVVWDMLTEAGFDVRQDKALSTALYYGLFTDTGRMQELRHPKDKDLRDALHFACLPNLLFLLQNCNLSRGELDIVSQALSGCRYNAERQFALAAVRPCDPNILGIISDMMMEVDDIDICVAFCMKSDGAKISVRSCTPTTRAHELADYLTGDGGGHARKAGGFLHRSKFLSGDADALLSAPAAEEYLWRRLETYFQETVCYTAGRAETVPDLRNEPVYRKERLPIGYVKASDMYPVGTEVSVRMLEGDITFTVQADTYFMIGVEGEVYQNSEAHFLARNDLSDAPYTFRGEYAPNVRSAVSTISLDGPPEAPKDLLDYVKTCVPKGGKIHARQISTFTKIFVSWSDDYLLGRPGDWIACPVERPLDVYIIKREIFDKSYTRAEG